MRHSIPDPLAEAEILLAYGRKAQALAVLREAAAADPGRVDIKHKLSSLTTPDAVIRRPALASLPHLILAWLLFLSSLLLVVGLAWLLAMALEPAARHLFPSDPKADLPLLGIVAVIAVAGFAAFVGTYAALVLFLHAWFGYLNLLPEATRMMVDARLPRAMAVRRMDPLYSRVRRRVLKLSVDASSGR